MDRNTIIGLGLILVIFVGYVFINKPSEAEVQRRQQYQDSIAEVLKAEELKKIEEQKLAKQVISPAIADTLPDSLRNAALESKFGGFAQAVEGKREFAVLENDKIKVRFLNQGGRVYSVEIKDYKTSEQKPLMFFDGDSTVFGFQIQKYGINTNSLYFKPQFEGAYFDASSSKQEVAYRLPAGANAYVEYKYSLEPGSYQVKFDMAQVNTSSEIIERDIQFEWEAFMPQQEHGRKWEADHTTIVINYDEEENDGIDELGIGQLEKEDLEANSKWIAFRQQFFSAAFIADEHIGKSGFVESEKLPLSEKHTKRMKMAFDLPNQPEWGGSFYFGPNHFPTLRAQGNDLHELIDLGWALFGWINRFVVIPLFNFLSSFIDSYGLIILILTIVIKAVLFPLTYKSYLSTAKMRVLKPQVDEINAQFPDKADAMKKQQAVMGLYKKVGVSPLGGCLPMLVQMPILFAMFRFFPASIELRQKSFLWAHDLSTYDAIFTWNTQIPLVSEYFGNHLSLFTLLMAISMVATNQLNSANMTTAPGQPNMKGMMWIMSVMMLVFFNSYASGLSYYYLIANLITIGQTMLIRRTINDEAILAKLEAFKKNPRENKTRMQRKLEEIAKKRGMH